MNKLETMVFGNGCFWCTEAVFSRLRGIVSAKPGYAGGTIENPAYKDVSSGKSGYAEAIKVEYNPNEITYSDLLNVFFATHDPTSLNRQGADVGNQYRSVIFYNNNEEKRRVKNFIDNLEREKIFDKKIVTKLEPLDKFYEAEDYHHSYYENNKDKPYCRLVINPKIEKLKRQFTHLLKGSA